MTQHPSENGLDPALRRLIAVLLLGGIMGILDGSMAAVAIDALRHTFHSSLATISWVSTGYLLALTVTIPVTAWAVDRMGARRLWLAGLVLFLIGSVASGLSPGIGSLIVFRVVQGIGAGILDPLMLTLLARAAGPARVGRVMGVMGVAGSSGPVLGPVLGGMILQYLDWRWMFLVNVPIVVAAFALSRRILPPDAAAGRTVTPLDVLGVALVGPGVAAGVLALSESAQRGTFAAWPVLLSLTAAVVLLGGYAVHALRRRSAPPLIELRMFASRAFSASVGTGALSGLATFASLFLIPLYYQQVRGHGVFAAGLLLAPLGVGSAISMPLSGRLSDRFGSRVPVRIGAGIALLSSIGFGRLTADTNHAWLAVLAFALGFGLGSVGAPTIGSLYRTLPPAQVAQGSSVLYMLNQLGASIGIALVALIVQNAASPLTGFRTAYWWIVAALTVTLLVSPLIPGRPAPAGSPAGLREAK
ncbi:MDR family MFS transporter [Amycolatopsis ultiminotia]|uniref:MDR family MFS transporter n=1 Tax=Amycolatopsis ultiminotia TaxID=543629 RepID=A0ABP6W4K6_9PSEU